MTESKQPQNSLEIPSKMSVKPRRFYSKVWFALRGQQRVLPSQSREGRCAKALPNQQGSPSRLLLGAQFYFSFIYPSIYIFWAKITVHVQRYLVCRKGMVRVITSALSTARF